MENTFFALEEPGKQRTRKTAERAQAGAQQTSSNSHSGTGAKDPHTGQPVGWHKRGSHSRSHAPNSFLRHSAKARAQCRCAAFPRLSPPAPGQQKRGTRTSLEMDKSTWSPIFFFLEQIPFTSGKCFTRQRVFTSI